MESQKLTSHASIESYTKVATALQQLGLKVMDQDIHNAIIFLASSIEKQQPTMKIQENKQSAR